MLSCYHRRDPYEEQEPYQGSSPQALYTDGLLEHHQNILRHGQFFLRCINIQIFTHSIIISKIAVNHKHRKLTDQIQTLAEYIRNACIIRFIIVRIQLKNTSCNTVHHITARCLHDHVTHKIRWKHPSVSYHILKILKFLLIRKLLRKEADMQSPQIQNVSPQGIRLQDL